MSFKIKKRCIRCMKILREDGTCQNQNCVRYTPESKLKKNSENK